MQALSPSQAADADVESHAERVQQRLACDPWQLHAACAELDPGMLSPDAAAAQEACHRCCQSQCKHGQTIHQRPHYVVMLAPLLFEQCFELGASNRGEESLI